MDQELSEAVDQMSISRSTSDASSSTSASIAKKSKKAKRLEKEESKEKQKKLDDLRQRIDDQRMQTQQQQEQQHAQQQEQPAAKTMQSCNTCSGAFADSIAYRNHFKSEWHRHNLKRKMKNLPIVPSEEAFAALAVDQLEI
jgi:TolA-binding protein